MKILDYIHEHSDWKETLSAKPYSLRIRENPRIVNEYILSYNQIESDFSIDICRECRGLIIDVNDTYPRIVAHAFDKFFNAGETHAATIDWKTAVTREKIDGSLIRRFHDGAHWRWATNNGFDADSELPNAMPIDGADSSIKTFNDAVDAALTDAQCVELVRDELKDWTLMFELCSPYNRVVVNYGPKPKLFLIGARERSTDVEHTPEEVKQMFGLTFEVPMKYKLSTLDQCLKFVEKLNASKSVDHEGFVVQDAKFNRIKIKSSAYLSVHHLKDDSGQLSLKRCFECIKSGVIDDVVAQFPEYKTTIDGLINTYNEFMHMATYAIRFAWEMKITPQPVEVDARERRKRFANVIMGSRRMKPFSSACFDLLKKSSVSIEDEARSFVNSLDYDEFVRKHGELSCI